MGRMSVAALVVVMVLAGVPGSVPPPRTESGGHHHLADPHSRHRVAATQTVEAQTVEALAEGPGTGRWTAPIDFPLVPAAAALLPNGKVLAWSAYLPDTFTNGTGRTVTAIFDPAIGTVMPRTVSNTGHDMFCPGISALADGRIVVTGGNNSDLTSVYHPATDTWSVGDRLAVPRGYQSSTVLSDGRLFTIGGSWSGGLGGKDGEVWSPTGGWQRLPGAAVAPMLTADAEGIYHADNHPWLFGWSDRSVLQAGPSRAMNWYQTSGSGATAPAGLRGDDTDAMNGTAVMFDAGRILTAGGAPSYTNSPATRNAYVITINNGATAVRKVAPMAHARAFHNSVVLPDGKVLVLGGQDYAVPFTDTGAAMKPELWNPATETFTPMAPMAVPRTYHSVALLLPDARVLAAGGGLCGNCPTNHPNGQIFTPPYLLNTDGTPAARPVITSAPTDAAPGASVIVGVDRPVTAFSLVRTGTVTHTVDTDQRRIALSPTPVVGGYRLDLPADPGVLLPGYYLLFALEPSGVPSVARYLRIAQTTPFGTAYGDPFSDLTLLHRLPDNGFDAHLLLGGAGIPFQNTVSYAGRMPASIGWDWNKIKPATGDFNSDGYADVALVHQLPDNGADLHVLWGGTNPFTNPATFVRRLAASAGWRWTDFKVVTGRFNGDNAADLAILHRLPDNGFHAHLLLGGPSNTFQNPTTFTRHLPASAGWDWNKIKPSPGDFNQDGYEDIALVHQLPDNGADIHVLWGGTNPFTYPDTFTRRLDASAGWRWTDFKVVTGRFNGDNAADLAILHRLPDNGFHAHLLLGGVGIPFQNTDTFRRDLPASAAWDWNKIKPVAGGFNSDGYQDIALLRQLPDNGADIHVLWGGTNPFTYPDTFTRHLDASAGWQWSQILAATTTA
ncbi:MAG TPA: galactose oxidase-like domain-containing protein [Candidatus Limnocylindrales bacterium]|nr:galactose oxidase-like domain-containing protein [Candidatus Limnocylindrales bacterium]